MYQRIKGYAEADSEINGISSVIEIVQVKEIWDMISSTYITKSGEKEFNNQIQKSTED